MQLCSTDEKYFAIISYHHCTRNSPQFFASFSLVMVLYMSMRIRSEQLTVEGLSGELKVVPDASSSHVELTGEYNPPEETIVYIHVRDVYL